MTEPVKSRLQLKAEDKQQRIIEAATRLFAEKGFHGTAVPEVASLAQVGAGTIYRYFDSKEALVNAVFQHAKSHLKDCLITNFNFEASPRALFHQFWQRLTGFAKDHPIEFRFLELQDHVPYLDQHNRNLELEILAPIWAFCVKSKLEGVARNMPAEALMAMIWGSLVGLMKAEHLGYLVVNEETLAQAEDTCWAMFSVA